MAGNERNITQYRIEFPSTPSLPDPREFTCPNDCASYCVRECGLLKKTIAIHLGMSEQLLGQKLRGETTSLSCNEYKRLGRALVELGKREYGELMFKCYAVELLPAPTKKEKLIAEMKTNNRRNAEITAELERL